MPHPTQTQPVFDPLLRLLHWATALAVAALIATRQLADWLEHSRYEKTLWNLHVLGGYALTTGLLARLLWGVAGPVSS